MKLIRPELFHLAAVVRELVRRIKGRHRADPRFSRQQARPEILPADADGETTPVPL